MDNEGIFIWIGIVIALVIAFTRPHERIVCPRDWYVEGVRPSGATQCRPAEPDDPNDWPGGNEAVAPRGYIQMQIYCTNGQQPIVVNERTVGCQARH